MNRLKIIVAALCITFLTGVANLSFAEEQKTTYLVVGYKAWFNTWTTPVGHFAPQGGANFTQIQSDSVVASIPSVALKISDFLISSSYMISPTYTFTAYTDTINISGTPFTSKSTTTAERKELDVNVGYYVAPSLAITLGYKTVDQDYHTKESGTGLVSTSSDSTTKYKGPTIGVAGSAQIGGGFGIYGNGAYGQMKATYTGVSREDDAIYASSELGLTYRPANWINLSLAYKIQTIDTDDGTPAYSGQNAVTDTTKGYILGANLIF